MLQRWLERNDFRVHSTYAHICANKQISLCIKTRIDKEDMLTMDERCVSKRKAIGNSEFFTALVVCFVHFICSLSRKVRKRSDIFRICVQLKFSPRIRSTNQIHQTHRDKFSVCTGCSCVFQFHETKAIWGAFLRGVPQEFTPFKRFVCGTFLPCPAVNFWSSVGRRREMSAHMKDRYKVKRKKRENII